MPASSSFASIWIEAKVEKHAGFPTCGFFNLNLSWSRMFRPPLVRRSLGRTEGTALTAFTDGCPGLRRILLKAGVCGLPILDWFHVAMRLQHLGQVAGGLASDRPERAAAKAVIVEEVERLRWRLWNGKAKDAKLSIDRIRAVMHHFRDERGGRGSVAPSRKLWTALQALDGYLVGQGDRLVDHGERHRAGLRVGTALTEGTANFPGGPPDEQVAADALVAVRRRPAAPGSLRRLQRHARQRLRAALPRRQ